MQNTDGQNQQRAKYDFSRELEEKLSEESRRERESVCKISFLREEKENFFPNLEFREENKNFFFKILTFENISRNENSILQLEIKKNEPFPLEIFSRSRISSMPDSRPSQAPPFHEGGHQGDQASSSLSPERTSLAKVTSLVFCPQWHSPDLSDCRQWWTEHPWQSAQPSTPLLHLGFWKKVGNLLRIIVRSKRPELRCPSTK